MIQRFTRQNLSRQSPRPKSARIKIRSKFSNHKSAPKKLPYKSPFLRHGSSKRTVALWNKASYSQRSFFIVRIRIKLTPIILESTNSHCFAWEKRILIPSLLFHHTMCSPFLYPPPTLACHLANGCYFFLFSFCLLFLLSPLFLLLWKQWSLCLFLGVTLDIFMCWLHFQCSIQTMQEA